MRHTQNNRLHFPVNENEKIKNIVMKIYSLNLYVQMNINHSVITVMKLYAVEIRS
jgi:hypothetical protein